MNAHSMYRSNMLPPESLKCVYIGFIHFINETSVAKLPYTDECLDQWCTITTFFFPKGPYCQTVLYYY